LRGFREKKIRGGKVKVQIHASNVQIISLNTDDEYRMKGTRKKKEKKPKISKSKEKMKKSTVKKEIVQEKEK
jgi:large subunit ribosomal protein L24